MWDYLKTSSKPIVLYGMGNAALRIIDELTRRDIKVSGIFASDGFVRGHEFAGHKVLTYSEAKEQFKDMIVLLCFGTHIPDVIDNIKRIAAEQELYAPDLPVVGEGLFTKQYAIKHKEDLEWLSNVLADDKSRDVLANLLAYRQSGVIDYLFKAETDDKDNFNLFGFTDEEIYLDLGAYTGDTALEFANMVSSYKRIYAVEPEERNFRKLFENTKELENIQLVNAAIGDVKGEILFTHGVGRGGALGKGKTRPVLQESIDSILNGNPASYIKMDLEGEEGRALLGGKDSIAKYKPKMLVACYHRIDDFWKLPKQILELNPNYKIYLRKSKGLPCWEVNLYCI